MTWWFRNDFSQGQRFGSTTSGTFNHNKDKLTDNKLIPSVQKVGIQVLWVAKIPQELELLGCILDYLLLA
jgi:hypothetical protein